jgi:3-hydroxyacyl-CoA dehydrogenase
MEAQDIQKVTCLGAGLIGASWATHFARHGLAVSLFDPAPDSLQTAPDRIRNNYKIFQDNGYMTQEAADASLARIRFVSDFSDAVKDAQFIQECGPEVLAVKRETVARIDAVNADAIVCSSTSGLSLSEIAGQSPYARRYFVGHPFNPPHLMPLVEIVRWDKGDPALLQVTRDFYTSVKKEPVILNKETPGFIGNRLQTAYVKEAVQIVSEGICSVEDLDKASVFGLGVRWAIVGPHLNGELNGGAGGIQNYLGGAYKSGFDAAFQRILSSDIAEMPVLYSDKIAPDGVAEELKNRLPATGNTAAAVADYRDKTLLEILRILDKI